MLPASRARGMEAVGLVAAWLDEELGAGEEERRTESRECSRGGNAGSRHGGKGGCCHYDDEERDGEAQIDKLDNYKMEEAAAGFFSDRAWPMEGRRKRIEYREGRKPGRYCKACRRKVKARRFVRLNSACSTHAMAAVPLLGSSASIWSPDASAAPWPPAPSLAPPIRRYLGVCCFGRVSVCSASVCLSMLLGCCGPPSARRNKIMIFCN